MEDFIINDTSVYKSSNYNDKYNYDYTVIISDEEMLSDTEVVTYIIIISISLPLTLLAIYGLYSQVRKDHVAPVYIINLLISDIIQLCCKIVHVAKPASLISRKIADFSHDFGLMASVCFMVCVSLERYLVIAWPLWYRFRRTIKTSVVVSVVVWIISLAFLVSLTFWVEHKVSLVIFGVFFLLPFPLLIFFLFGTIKALSEAISVSPDEKRRIVAILVLVLLIYTLLFLPTIIWLLAEEVNSNALFFVSDTFVSFSPLADLFLYVFSRKGAVDKFLACVCCCRMNSERDISMNDINS